MHKAKFLAKTSSKTTPPTNWHYEPIKKKPQTHDTAVSGHTEFTNIDCFYFKKIPCALNPQIYENPQALEFLHYGNRTNQRIANMSKSFPSDDCSIAFMK